MTSSNTNSLPELSTDTQPKQLENLASIIVPYLNQSGTISYTRADGAQIQMTVGSLKELIDRGYDIEDVLVTKHSFTPAPLPETLPSRHVSVGGYGIYGELENELMYSPQGDRCLMSCFIHIYPDKSTEITEHFLKKRKVTTGRGLTHSAAALGLSISYLTRDQKQANRNYVSVVHKGYDHYLTLVNPKTGVYPQHEEIGHWIFVKQALIDQIQGVPSKANKLISEAYLREVVKEKLGNSQLKNIQLMKYRTPSKNPNPYYVYAFDLETYAPRDEHGAYDGPFVLYACGFRRFNFINRQGVVNFERTLAKIDQFPYQMTKGPSAVIQMLHTLEEQHYENNQNRQCDIFLYAHNGARFDVYVAIQHPDVFVEFTPSTIIKTPSGIIHLKLTSIKYPNISFIFKDTYKHLACSLSNIAKNFNFEEQKGALDHNKITADNWESLEPEWGPYLETDVNVLVRAIIYINQMYVEVGIEPKKCRPPFLENLSAPAAAQTYILQQGFTAEKLVNPLVRTFIKAGVIGGRVQAIIKNYEHPEFKSIMHKAEHSPNSPLLTNHEEGLICLDANSLYPSAIATGALHVGGAQIYQGTTQEMLNSSNLIIVKIDLIIPPKNLLFPVLATRSYDTLVWSNEDIHNGIYTNIDLQEASKVGYIIGNILEGILWTQTSESLTSCVDKLYEERLKVKKTNPIKADGLKTITNSIYGKMVQRDIMSKYTFTKERPDNFRLINTWQIGGWYLSDIRGLNYQPLVLGGPSHIGAEILSKSKKIMNDAVRAADLFFKPGIYYTDTDSLYVHKSHVHKFSELIGPKTGQFKNDYGENTIIVYARFICPKVKLCIIYNTVTNKLTTKSTFKGLSCRGFLTETTGIQSIKEHIALFQDYERGNFTKKQTQWKRTIDLGIVVKDFDKVFEAPKNKRGKPVTIDGVKTVMPPYGYDMNFTTQNPETLTLTKNPKLEQAKTLIQDWQDGKIDKLLITGAAGTGKTQLIKDTLDLMGNTVTLLAPTRMAASNYESGRTIHSFLLSRKEAFSRTDDEGNVLFSSVPIIHTKCKCTVHSAGICDPISCESNICGCLAFGPKDNYRWSPLTFAHSDMDLIIDEFSMVDRELLLSAKRLIIVGDINQLEPIGGHSLTTEDLSTFHTVELTHNYRAKNTAIRELYKLARSSPMAALETIPTITKEECWAQNIPILSWRRSEVDKLEKKTYPKPFMVTRDDPDGRFYSGQVLTVQAPPTHNKDPLTQLVSYTYRTKEGGVITTYTRKSIRDSFKSRQIRKTRLRDLNKTPQLFTASAFTVHKAQGQTFPKVAINKSDITCFSHSKHYSDKLPYTAITRGREVFVI